MNTKKQVDVQAFVTQSPIKAFDISIFHWFAKPNKFKTLPVHFQGHPLEVGVLCRKKGLHKGEIAFAVNMSIRRVEEYEELIEEFAQRNPAFERSLAGKIEDVLKTTKEEDI